MKLKVVGTFKTKSHLHLDVTKNDSYVTNLELSQHMDDDVTTRKRDVIPEVGQLVDCMVKEPLKKGSHGDKVGCDVILQFNIRFYLS